MSSNYSNSSRPSIEKGNIDSSTASIVSGTPSTKSPSITKKMWESIKKHAKEHHESVNAAYEVYYGQGYNTRRPN
ncbi:hypothetical protein CC78DRAFT_528505 [Lojkania enalia]|uniref:Uncharacterized protein n=1 Tax=Lojkania enalia TaxID=147567 RepID=A0A9P4TPC1_9PLEO|nr:hypothetical protein CC78DRAFT_528505 [Didymosphaeria enalia]